jgi:hypothetical protein
MPDTPRKPDITPDTNIGVILDAYPDIVPYLIDLSPALARLRNPVMRASIGGVANLRQIAELSNLPLGVLVNELRMRAGLGVSGGDIVENATGPSAPPAWFATKKIAVTYDARNDLAAGVHPAQRVMAELQDLSSEGIYELVTPFTPSPLIDMAVQKGFTVWTSEAGPSEVHNYFSKA